MSLFGTEDGEFVAWSKSGLIAYLDSRSSHANLCITFMETINGTNWRLHPCKRYVVHPHLLETQSPAGASSIVGGGGGGSSRSFHNLNSVHWNNLSSHTGEQLAACDELGNLTIIAAGQSMEGQGTLDKMIVLCQDNIYKTYNLTAPLQEVNPAAKIYRKQAKKEVHTTIIEFMWIGTQKPVLTMLGARKDSTTSTFHSQIQQCQPYGLFHPASIKSAFIALRRGGQLDFWYQFSNSRDHKKISLQLNGSHEARSKQFEWFQMGGFAQMEDDQALLIGAFSKLSNSLSFYRLHVNWNLSSQNSMNDPSLKLQHLLEIKPDYVGPQGELLNFTNFELLSPTHDRQSPLELLMCYEVAGLSRSIVKRYSLIKAVPSAILTIEFGVLNTEIPSSGSDYSFSENEVITFDSGVTAAKSYNSETLVIFKLKNGRIEVYNRKTWRKENHEFNKINASASHAATLSSPFCTGLNFPEIPPPAVTGWSEIAPALGGVLTKSRFDGELQFHPVTAPVTDDSQNDSNIAAAFAYAFVCANHLQASGEDLSIAIKTYMLRIRQQSVARSDVFLREVICIIYHLFGLTPDASKEVKDKLIMSRPIQRAMLLQLELGSSFDNSNVYNMSRTAMSLRNILFAFNGVSRNIQVLIHHSATMNFQQSNGKLFQFAFSKQDLIYSLIPCAKWFVKLVTFLTQQMIVLVNSPQDKDNTLVLGILSSKMTRQLLLSVLSEIRKIIHLVTKFPETAFPILNESSIYLRKVLGDSPVNFEKFETFLADVNNKFTSLSEQQAQGNAMKDSYLIIEGDIPEEISHLKEFMLSYSNTAVLSHIKPSEVYFSDTRGLRIFASELFSDSIFKLLQPLEKGLVVNSKVLSESISSSSFCVAESDDISKDTLKNLNEGQKVKRCCRCGAITRAGYTVSKDNTIVPTSISTKRWTSLYLKTCICSGFLYEL
ncbi:Sin4p [Lachancea thermotolerans CBS 6340]|uniref:Mediator of RNA polymerase II transcription subunit 16 n=1 Tax=Lachancea thermotolerans (strain ATCC 56472 / CBS 6340 / NRRL Y-8284) TaxID=559295 RepID=C5E1X7_LACTC|nr:KLTH0H00462p [Lachancea thermotolerans CBS 6340]CAR30038.1 KLTH0H00462p [Lachancea thermotolerans CBS 6340]